MAHCWYSRKHNQTELEIDSAEFEYPLQRLERYRESINYNWQVMTFKGNWKLGWNWRMRPVKVIRRNFQCIVQAFPTCVLVFVIGSDWVQHKAFFIVGVDAESLVQTHAKFLKKEILWSYTIILAPPKGVWAWRTAPRVKCHNQSKNQPGTNAKYLLKTAGRWDIYIYIYIYMYPVVEITVCTDDVT